MPFGLNDSLGHEAWVRWFEERLSRTNTPELRWASAVARHLGGDVPRARELYRRLPNDARARENLAALERGDLAPPHPLTTRDIHAATFGTRWKALGEGLAWLFLTRAPELDIGGALTLVRCVAGLVLLLRCSPRGGSPDRGRPGSPRRTGRLRGQRPWFPGCGTRARAQ
jgi:hypothetical protein